MDVFSLVLLAIFIVVSSIPLVEKYKKRRKIAKVIDSLGGDKWYPIIGTELLLMRAGRKKNFYRKLLDIKLLITELSKNPAWVEHPVQRKYLSNNYNITVTRFKTILDFWKEYQRRNERHGSVFRSWSGSKPIIHLRKPEHIEAVLNTTENIDKGSTYKFMQPWFGNGLLTSKKSKWKVHRKLLTPSFHFSILENFSDIFSVKSQMLSDQIFPLANGEYFNIFPYLAHCALDIICETAMGVKINAMEHSDSEYVKAVSGLLEKIMERIFNPIFHNNFIYSLTEKGRAHNKYLHILHKFTEKVIRDRQAKLMETKAEDSCKENLVGSKKKLTFLDLLLGINQTNDDFHLTFEDIRDEVSTFMFGGHDSSTVTACWTLFLLGNYPVAQEKVHKELDNIFRGGEQPVSCQDLLEMKYLECVIKESLRIFTVVPAISRELSMEIDIDGHKIPPGVTAVLHFYQLHRDPELYPDADSFIPERFLQENMRNRHPFSFLPFSAGPRNCIGQKYALRSAKTLLSTLLRRYSVKALKKPEEIDCYFDVFLRPQDGMYLSFDVRNVRIPPDYLPAGYY